MAVPFLRCLALLIVACLLWAGLRWWVRHVLLDYDLARQTLTDYQVWRKANVGVPAPRAAAAAHELEKALARWEAQRPSRMVYLDTAVTVWAARKRLAREQARAAETTTPRRNP